METPVCPGDVLLGKYRVERVLGKGGMGVVVAARHVDLGELYAIKFMLASELESPDALDRFLREARASARLRGEHVAKVHDVGRLETGAPYMVMEYLEGKDLKGVLRERGPLPEEEATALLLQACEGVAEAHASGVIHRDLKLANLFLIRRPNGTPCIKVLDFGISKDTTPDAVDLTSTGMVMGSPRYMSPEQMANTKDADARSDVWSLGVVLYELVTGRGPFDADAITKLVASVLNAEPEPPSRLRAALSSGLDYVVARCLEKRPENRFQSVEELAAALRSIAGTRASSPSLTPPVERALSLPPTLLPPTLLPPTSLPRTSLPPASLPPTLLPPASLPRTSLPPAPPPDATTVRRSQPEAMPASVRPLDAAPPPPSHPGTLSQRASTTASAWGGTGAEGPAPQARLDAGRAGAVAALVIAGATLGIAGTWLVQGSAQRATEASPPVDVASPTAPAADAVTSPVTTPLPAAPPAPPAPSVAPPEPPGAELPSAPSPASEPVSMGTTASGALPPSEKPKAGTAKPRLSTKTAATAKTPAKPAQEAPRPQTKNRSLF